MCQSCPWSRLLQLILTPNTARVRCVYGCVCVYVRMDLYDVYGLACVYMCVMCVVV